jgi:hypothetical protein
MSLREAFSLPAPSLVPPEQGVRIRWAEAETEEEEEEVVVVATEGVEEANPTVETRL